MYNYARLMDTDVQFGSVAYARESLAQSSVITDSFIYKASFGNFPASHNNFKSSLRGELRKSLSIWRNEAKYMSSIQQIMRTPSAQIILNGGKESAKMILERLAAGENFVGWFPALKRILDASPVPAESVGKPNEMAKHWIDWGRRAGLI